MEHSLISSADPESVDIMDGQFGEIVEFDEIGISEDIVLIFLFSVDGIKDGGDGFGIGEGTRPTEFFSDPGVLIKLGHLNLYNLSS